MKALQIGHDYAAPLAGFANGCHTWKLKLWALRVGLRWITGRECPLTWFAFCPAPAGLVGFSVYLRRLGFGWRWKS